MRNEGVSSHRKDSQRACVQWYSNWVCYLNLELQKYWHCPLQNNREGFLDGTHYPYSWICCEIVWHTLCICAGQTWLFHDYEDVKFGMWSSGMSGCRIHMFLLDLRVPIMKYMGDYPSKKQRLGTDLTDQVFEHGLVHVSGAWGRPWQLWSHIRL